jgi:hypothetical protein
MPPEQQNAEFFNFISADLINHHAILFFEIPLVKKMPQNLTI